MPHGFRTDDKAWLRDAIFAMSRTQFQVVRHLIQTKEWDYFHFVDIGLDRIHHGFWKYHDPQHVLHEPDSPFKETVHDYYRHLDDEIGKVLELLTDDTIVLLVSDHGAQRLDGGFCVNEWLVREGLLVLKSYPKEVTPFAKLDVDWEKTKVWSEGGYYARVFFNVKGREPQGTIEPAEYESFRDEIKAKFEATVDREGKPMGTLVFKPEQIYKRVKNVAPDLIVHFGGLYWRSIGGVGYPTIHVLENDTGPDDCNHAQFGAFVLAASEQPAPGRGDRRPAAGHRADPDGAGRLRGPRGDAGPLAGRRRVVIRRRRLRARRRDDRPRPAERAGIHRISGRRDAVRVPRLRSRNGRTLNSPLKFGLPRSSLFPRFSRRRPFIRSDRDGLFVPRAIEALARRGILHAPGGRRHCASPARASCGHGVTSNLSRSTRESLSRPGIAPIFHRGTGRLRTGTPSPRFALFRPILLATARLAQAPAPSSPVRSDPWCCTIAAPCWDGPDSPDELTDLSLSHPRHNTSPPDRPPRNPPPAHTS